MIYPRCFNGTEIPFITCKGYLSPCCRTGNRFYVLKNELTNEAFNLNKHSFMDVVTGSAWIDTIKGIHNTEIRGCNYNCGIKQAPRTSNIIAYDDKYSYQDVYVPTASLASIQLETTSRCTLECPYCSRANVINRGNGALLNRDDLSLDIIDDVLTNAKHIETIVDCGTFGDGIFYKHYHEMLDLMVMSDNLKFYTMSIAATGKTQSWWDDTHLLWKLLSRKGILVIVYWGIDGLEDTSSMHRVNQNWDEITDNMRRAVSSGIENNWQFIPMRFNEHQVEDAYELSKRWNVNFHIKPSDRFKEGDPNTPINDDMFFEMRDGVSMNNPSIEYRRIDDES